MTEVASLREDLALAHELALEASEIALGFFERGARVERKPDGSPVTDADLEVERALVGRLRRRRPADGILGEELGARGPARRRWILDPIDGTANFVAGRSDWGTHIALECEAEIVLGVISRPVLARQWWATRGGGAWRGSLGSAPVDAAPVRVSRTTDLRESVLAVWAEPPHPAIDRLRARARLVDADLDAVVRVAEGALDAAIDVTGREWDHAPAVVLVEEAGGRFSDARGGRRIDLGEGRYTNGHLHDALAQALAGGDGSAQTVVPTADLQR